MLDEKRAPNIHPILVDYVAHFDKVSATFCEELKAKNGAAWSETMEHDDTFTDEVYDVSICAMGDPPGAFSGVTATRKSPHFRSIFTRNIQFELEHIKLSCILRCPRRVDTEDDEACNNKFSICFRFQVLICHRDKLQSYVDADPAELRGLSDSSLADFKWLISNSERLHVAGDQDFKNID